MNQEHDKKQALGSPQHKTGHAGACLSPTDFVALVENQSTARTPRLHRHLEECHQCRLHYEQWKRDETLANELRQAAVNAKELGPHSDLPDDPASHDSGEYPFPRIDGYRILSIVGRGGMGIVYEAIQVSLGRRVALKVLPDIIGAASPEAITRFRREAVSAGKLHHTNIVPVYDYGSSKDAHFCAMELIDGRSLDALIPRFQDLFSSGAASIEFAELLAASQAGEQSSQTERVETAAATRPPGSSGSSSIGRGQIYFRQVATWVADVADALDYAHREGVIHRDIKPSNLILARTGRLMITDFGLARDASDHSVTRTGALLGTLRYMSPEQAMAKRMPLDHRTDIYSLGATLYELLTFRAPFIEKNDKELLGAIITKDPKPPCKVLRSIPKDLETICLKALEKSPDKRYLSARELADDLRRFTGSLPILARRPRPVARFAKMIGRHKAITAAITATLLLLGAVVLIVIDSRERQWIIEEGERALAERQIETAQRCVALDGANRYKDVLDCVDELFEHPLTDDLRQENLRRRARARKELYNASSPKDLNLLNRAVDDVNNAIQLDERDADAWNLKGVLHKIEDDFPASLSAHERSLSIKRLPETLLNVATLLVLAQQDVDGAEELLREAEENLRDDAEEREAADAVQREAAKYAAYVLAEVWQNLASIQWARGDPEASDSINRAVRYHTQAERPDCGRYLLKARILLHSSTNEASDAIVRAEASGGLGKPLVCRLRAQVDLERGDWERAWRSAKAAIEAGDGACHNQLIIARAAASLGKMDDARAAFKAATDTRPEELAAPGGFIASAPDGILWFDTYEELKELSEQASKLIADAEAGNWSGR